MKIIHISTYPDKNAKHTKAGGVASYTKNLITNTNYRPKDEVFVLCDKINGKYTTYHEDRVKVIRCFDKKPLFITQILSQIRRIKPDVIHFQHEFSLFGSVTTAYLLPLLMLILKKQKKIITIHGIVPLRSINRDFVKGNFVLFPPTIVKLGFIVLYRSLALFADKIIVHEKYFKNILVNDYKIRPQKTYVIFHGVEEFETISKTNACKKLNLEAKKDIMLFMGYLTGYKGIDLLIEEFSKYSKESPNSFLIIGAGKHPKYKDETGYQKEYKRLQKKARKMINKDQYKWVGFIPEKELTTYYSAADISVYPYTTAMSSSGPMAIAIGHGKPFVASDAFNKVLDEQLIFKRDKNSLSLKLAQFFQQSKEYHKVAKELKNERRWKKVADKIYKMYI